MAVTKTTLKSTLQAKLIYIFGIDDEAHKGCLKIGDATLDEDIDILSLQNNCKDLNRAARKRIDSYTKTAGIDYQLLHTELAMRSSGKKIESFRDYDVHQVLIRSGISKKKFKLAGGKAHEWFVVDLETAKNAITAVKKGQSALDGSKISHGKTPIILREEQRRAIKQTKDRFAVSDKMLWNAKMRFGKTLTALQLFKELNQEDSKKYRRMLILTHRPVVDASWFEDFSKVFYEDDGCCKYGSRNNGYKLNQLEESIKSKKGTCFVYFASIQDLRGAKAVGGKFAKNEDIFDSKWDLLVVDEAHEGTNTELGQNVLKKLIKKGTKQLALSGTPFSLFMQYKEDEIFTWSYVDEQEAKLGWDDKHLGDHNPYDALPHMNMFTYDLGELFDEFQGSEYSFNFHEFFAVDDEGMFIHEMDVQKFLDLLCDQKANSNYPFSTPKFISYFKHTFWLVPGVKEALALQHKLSTHPVFNAFKIVNVAGDGDPEDPNDEALTAVKDAIKENDYTITLSCGKLTTGVTVKEWTGVFMLAGSVKTSAATYMQTIFRVQSPGEIDGKQKTEAYVFDFAPDRVLTVMAKAAKTPTKPGKATSKDRENLRKLLNFFPIIAMKGGKAREYDVDQLLTRLKHTYIEKVVNNGFDDNNLYNDKLLNLDDAELDDFSKLKKIIGSTPAQDPGNDIYVNDQGFKGDDKNGSSTTPKPKKVLSPEDKARKEEENLRKKQRLTAISILRGISIRMPMLIYGAELKAKEEITIDNFANHIDDRSWEEFMPKGVTKDRFEVFKKYYDPDIFLESGRQIRNRALNADTLKIRERIRKIIDIFNTFRNPDKETVLTPWRVVNKHMSETLGGYNFFDEQYVERLNQPRFVDHGTITNRTMNDLNARILEINSKSGLYPLYVAYSLFRERCKQWERDGKFEISTMTLDQEYAVWDEVVANNLFVVCKTPMAVSITKRTLMGFRTDNKTNIKYYDDLVNVLQTCPNNFVKDVISGHRFWKNDKVEKEMKFNAVVGNPPYQQMDKGHGVSAKAIYNFFVDVARKLEPNYISMIMPSRWFVGGKGLDNFRKTMKSDSRISKIVDFEHSGYVFPGVDIAGGVCFFLWDRNYDGLCSFENVGKESKNTRERSLDEFEVIVRQNKAINIIRRLREKKINDGKTLKSVISARSPFDIATNYEPKNKGVPCWFTQKQGMQFVSSKDLNDDFDLKDKWKLLIPKAPIAGQTDFSKPVGFYYEGNVRIAKPGEICSDSWLVAYSASSKSQILAFKSYLFTKVVRFFLLQAVISQDVTRDNYCFVPDLGHYEGEYSDKELCKKWGITKDEWAYIDSRIKAVSEMNPGRG